MDHLKKAVYQDEFAGNFNVAAIKHYLYNLFQNLPRSNFGQQYKFLKKKS